MTSRATAVRPSKRASSEHFTATMRRNRLTVALVGSRLLEVSDIDDGAKSRPRSYNLFSSVCYCPVDQYQREVPGGRMGELRGHRTRLPGSAAVF
jgi:hypothetical protein